MKIETKKIKENIVQITTTDERWYEVNGKYIPSVSWILDYLPKGYAFEQWLKNNGNNADILRDEAGKKGSVVHSAIEHLLLNGKVKHDDKFLNNITGEEEEITPQEYSAVYDFKNWYDAVKPKTIQTETTIFNDKVAGTVDYICKIDKKIWVIDFKTSKQIVDSHLIQVAQYRRMLLENYPNIKAGILLLGKSTKTGYQFKEVDNLKAHELAFDSAYNIWNYKESQKQPPQKDLPLEIKIAKR